MSEEVEKEIQKLFLAKNNLHNWYVLNLDPSDLHYEKKEEFRKYFYDGFNTSLRSLIRILQKDGD